MTDLIDRQAAIDDVLDLHADHRVSWVDAVIDALETLPSAQPERKKGKWEAYGHDFFGDNEYRCTACGETANIKTDFCPNCGADMRGEGHDND